MNNFSHTSVLLFECIEALNIRDGYTYVDCTTGGGGHSLEIAKRSRGTPRIVNRLLKRVRDFSSVLGHDQILKSDAELALNRLDIDGLGLDATDKNLILSLIQKFGGGPVGLETLSATINEDKDTIEDVYEPYLLQLGFIGRTPRGRVALKRAYEHFGLPLPKSLDEQLTLFDT